MHPATSAADAVLDSIKVDQIWFDGFDIRDTGTDITFGKGQDSVMIMRPAGVQGGNYIYMDSLLQVGRPDQPIVIGAIEAYGANDPTIEARGTIGIRSIADERAIVANGKEIGLWAEGATGINATGTAKALAASSLQGTGVEAVSATGTALEANSWGGTAILTRGGGDMIRGGHPNPRFRVNQAGEIFSKGMLIQSDIEGKTDITPLTDVLPKLGEIRGISFRPSGPRAGPQERRRLSVIAQEVEEAFPELVRSWGEETRRQSILVG